MSESDIVIRVDKVSKDFNLPHEKTNSLKSIFIHPFKTFSSKTSTTKQHALDDISFQVKKGQFFGIVGRNGSGKSTLLKIIAGIYRPTNGVINVDGRLVPFIELGVGFNPELTGRENVYLNGALMGYSKKEVDAMYDDIVNFAELEEFMDQRLKNYSSGMQVRLAFSVATRSKADILLIDEVLAVGDADFQRKCFNYFRTLKKMKKTVIFVSHDMEAVREYCDECVVIDNSKIVYVGSPEVAAEKYVKLFNTQSSERTEVQEKNDERWGDKTAEVTGIEVKVKQSAITISMEVLFREKFSDPIIGFVIKNSSGEVVCGTNNRIVKKRFNDADPEDTISLQWHIPNIFSDDSYSVEVAVTHHDGVTQADWWHDAATFDIRNTESTPHIVSPKVLLEVNY